MPRPIIGVMGAGDKASADELRNAYQLGERLASDGWAVLTGGRDAGVMRAVNDGAKQIPGSLTIGIQPSAAAAVAPSVDVAIITEMHNARNNINVLSSRIVIACGVDGPGTASEIALALKAGKPVIILSADETARAFYGRLGGALVQFADTSDAAAELARPFLAG